MKTSLTLLFCISALLCTEILTGQNNVVTETNSINEQETYGLRVGIDLSKPIRTLLDKDYTGFEILGDFRVTKRMYLAAEIGTEEKFYYEPNLNARTQGSYLKIGGDFNAYRNWAGLHNAITIGLRYGVSNFTQELLAYTINATDQTFPVGVVIEPQEFSGLTAHWAELIVGIKTEVWDNVYIALNVQLKRNITDDKPDNFDNLYIPGFNRTYDFSEYGVGYGYSISYLIPLLKR